MPTAKPVAITGIQPSGDIHIGNYLGALKNCVTIQNAGKYDCFFFVADLHSLTQDYDPKKKFTTTLEAVASLLALGLDPKKSTLFIQSMVPEHTELAWYFNCVTPMGELERMTQYKDKAARQVQNINVGLFDYPVLQAADIALYNASFVPVGQDQVQHIELTRNIVHWFNRRYGTKLREPKALLTDIPKVLSLAEPTKKMSKSLGVQHYIALTDEPAVILDKLKRAVTETTGIVPITYTTKKGWIADESVIAHMDEAQQRGVRGVENLLSMLHHFAPPEVNTPFAQGPIRYGDLKKTLAYHIGEYFAEYRERRKALLKKPQMILELLEPSTARAQQVARATMHQLRTRIGVR